jgi:hypothetical protein
MRWQGQAANLGDDGTVPVRPLPVAGPSLAVAASAPRPPLRLRTAGASSPALEGTLVFSGPPRQPLSVTESVAATQCGGGTGGAPAWSRLIGVPGRRLKSSSSSKPVTRAGELFASPHRLNLKLAVGHGGSELKASAELLP